MLKMKRDFDSNYVTTENKKIRLENRSNETTDRPYCHSVKWSDGSPHTNKGKSWRTEFQGEGGCSWIDLEFHLLVSVSDSEMNTYATITQVEYCPKCGRCLKTEKKQ